MNKLGVPTAKGCGRLAERVSMRWPPPWPSWVPAGTKPPGTGGQRPVAAASQAASPCKPGASQTGRPQARRQGGSAGVTRMTDTQAIGPNRGAEAPFSAPEPHRRQPVDGPPRIGLASGRRRPSGRHLGDRRHVHWKACPPSTSPRSPAMWGLGRRLRRRGAGQRHARPRQLCSAFIDNDQADPPTRSTRRCSSGRRWPRRSPRLLSVPWLLAQAGGNLLMGRRRCWR